MIPARQFSADAALLETPASAWNEFRFREAAARLAGGLAIAACDDGGAPAGALIDQVTVLSTSPPRLLFCVAKTDPAHDTLLRAAQCSLTFLAQQDVAEARRFGEGRADRFLSAEWRLSPGEPPQYQSGVASLNGAVAQRLDAGTHSALIVHVTVQAIGEGEPLVQFRRRLRRLATPGEGPH